MSDRSVGDQRAGPPLVAVVAELALEEVHVEVGEALVFVMAAVVEP